MNRNAYSAFPQTAAAGTAPDSASTPERAISLPSVRLTQQDFVSTFPWGIRGDKVRILQQEVENEILDAETLSAMAFMLGGQSNSERLDEAWKLMLNSQNHDVHVCLCDETGMEWCNQARAIAAEVHQQAALFIAEKTGGDSVSLNTLSWDRMDKTRASVVPAFGYAVAEAKGEKTENEVAHKKWDGMFETESFGLYLYPNGSLKVVYGPQGKHTAQLGYFTVFADGNVYDSRSAEVSVMESWISCDGKTAFAKVIGRIGDIPFVNKITATTEFIDMETEFDYGDGCFFGPAIEDFETEPRRTHYFQHERKLCMNWQLPDADTELIYSSPFLAWPSKSRSIESLHYAALQADGYGIAHFNIGQSGYGYIENDSSCRHVLAFAPKDYIYGKAEKLMLSGRQTHRYRFMPYLGDWRSAKLPLCMNEYQRPMQLIHSGCARTGLPRQASLLRIDSNTTVATALFERNDRLFLRLWEWAGQEDSVTVKYGDGKSPMLECTHALRQIGSLQATFPMRPWEVKTIELIGAAIPLDGSGTCSGVTSLNAVPDGWQLDNHFAPSNSCVNPDDQVPDDAMIYFTSGYHDGFVKPLERHTPTMAIEMQRVDSPKYPGYTSSWELGGSCFVSMDKNEPEYLEALKPYLKDGKIEIVGGTWCEPFGLIISGESNIRQFLYGMEAMEKHLDIKVDIYMNQEHGTYAQMPQILKSFGLKAVVNRTQWAPYGYEAGFDADVAEWIGVDGTSILLIPRYHSMDYNNGAWDDRNLQNGSVSGHDRLWRTEENFPKIRDMAIRRGVNHPLMTMLEDIWSEELRSTDEEMDSYASLPYVRFVTIARYLAMLGL